MPIRVRLWIVMTLLLGQSACGLAPRPAPPPGWDDDVRQLFVEEITLPTGWHAHLFQETDVHPHANHVHRRFSNPPSAGIVSQDIWRAYTIADAAEKYAELRQSQFQPRLAPEEMVAPWEPPEEIDFQSTVADEYYLACGWEEWAYCQFLVRYRNYVTYLRLDRQADFGSHHSEGLTYTEVETVLHVVDAQFQTALEQLYRE